MIRNLDESNFDMSKFENKTVLLDFGAEYCIGCAELEPILEELSEEYTTIDFYKIKADENMNISKIFKIKSLPTLVLLINNEINEYLPEFKTKETLKNILNRYI
jgi:Thioredoxin domain-containing protein